MAANSKKRISASASKVSRSTTRKSRHDSAVRKKTNSWGFIKIPGSFNKPLLVVFMVLFAGIGSYLFLFSHAATPPPQAGGYFSTLQPGSTLPSDSSCAAQIHHSTWEPRVENNLPNHTVPTSVSIGGFTPNDGGVDQKARALADRVTGNFTGTTDEIIQWASCKWGFNDDIVRATAVTESSWFQAQRTATGAPIDGQGFGDFVGDQSLCQTGFTAPCPTSFGILQIKAPPADNEHRNSYPDSITSTAYSLDYALMVRRICYEGWTHWLYAYPGPTVSGQPAYQAGDEWGCVGFWYSGNWRDQSALNYIATVQNYYNTKPWRGWADNSLSPDSSGIVTVNDALKGTANNQFEYVGTWYSTTQTGAYGSDAHVAYNNGDYYQFRFHGTKVSLFSKTGPDGGTAGVSIDGGPETPVSFNSATIVNQAAVYSSPILSLGDHIVKVRNSSNSATAYTMWVDYAQVSTQASETTAPSVPTALSATAQSFSQINLAWTASTDDTGVSGYDVYRNNVKITTVATNSFSDTGLTASTAYSYYIIAKDAAGNSSSASNTVSATTQASVPAGDTTAPAVSITSPLPNATVNSSINVKATATDNVAVTKMEIYIDGNRKTTSTTGSISFNYTPRKLTRGAHTVTVKAYDAAGNVGTSSVTVNK